MIKRNFASEYELKIVMNDSSLPKYYIHCSKETMNSLYLCLQNYTHKIVPSSAMHYQHLVIIHECGKKLLMIKNIKGFFFNT